VQVFSQEHFVKIVVGLPGFVDDGSDFQELMALKISNNVLLIKVFFIQGRQDNDDCVDFIPVRVSICWTQVIICGTVTLKGMISECFCCLLLYSAEAACATCELAQSRRR
jgi:hypothetical protein